VVSRGNICIASLGDHDSIFLLRIFFSLKCALVILKNLVEAIKTSTLVWENLAIFLRLQDPTQELSNKHIN